MTANLEHQLILADEENSNLRRLQEEHVGSMEVMQDKINSLTVELNHCKSECRRLEYTLSEQKQQVRSVGSGVVIMKDIEI